MIQTLQARDLTLKLLTDRFGVQKSKDESFFSEWREAMLQVTPEEHQRLERIRVHYEVLTSTGSLSEEAVKMVVLAPLLDMAGFFDAPFQLQTEVPVEITAEDEGIVYKGKIDVLLLRERFWALVVEAKNTTFDVLVALPQALFYLLGASAPEKPRFALLINGRESIFVKLVQQDAGARYSLSRAFSILQPMEDLPALLAVLKHLAKLVGTV